LTTEVLREKQRSGIRVDEDLLIIEAIASAGLIWSGDSVAVITGVRNRGTLQPAMPDSPGFVYQGIEPVFVKWVNKVAFGIQQQSHFGGMLRI
jgi:hypothetical protein